MLRSSSGPSQEGKEPKFSEDRDHIVEDESEDLLPRIIPKIPVFRPGMKAIANEAPRLKRRGFSAR
jgi:hypothetical protein